jgi:hypothetical protein
MTSKTKSGASKLDYNKATAIKLLCKTSTLSDGEIGDLFGVSRVLINHIRHNRRWDDVPHQEEKENPFNPLKTIQQFMKEWEIDKLEYQNITIFMSNEKEKK